MMEAYILDLDGVITDTAHLHAKAWKETFDELLKRRAEAEGESFEPFDLKADYARCVDGRPRLDGVRSFLASRGIELPEGTADDPAGADTVRGVGSRKNRRFLALLEEMGTEVYADARLQIQRWHDCGVKLAVVSSSRNCGDILQAAEALAWFDVQVDGTDLKRSGMKGKPAPDMFLRAARLLGVEPPRAAVLEDAIAGVQAGSAGGFGLVVGVARHGNRQALLDHGADIVVTRLVELDSLDETP